MHTRIVILAAGKGVRMKSETPKVLQDLNGRPIISYLADSVLRAGIDPSPVVVIAKDGDTVRETLGEQFTYVVQDEQLGTGHAVQCAETSLRENGTAIMVLYGDHPLLEARAINKIAKTHLRGNMPITMATVSVSDFNDWRAGFFDFGRIVRDKSGEIIRIV